MEDKKYTLDTETFMGDHPELDPAWAPILEPMVSESEASLKAFILSYIFM